MSSQKKENYRPEIDGLRAFAVCAVILYHFNNNILPNGYLGVDIFFVISGYVITSSLAGRKSKNFLDFIGSFYQRRINRIIPALTFFILITTILTQLFIQNRSGQYYLTAAFSIIGVSNIYSSLQAGGYWGVDSQMNPFIHTWSLGVEEQFYLFFPFLIWFTGFGKQNREGSRNLLIVLSFLTTCSFIYFIYLYLYSSNESAIYFLMPNRFWEIASGSILFILRKRKVSIINKLENISPLFILGIMIFIMFLPKSSITFATILIIFLSNLLITSLRKGTRLFNLFSNKRVVYIGLISYSLYLWHWGILTISRWTIGIHWWSIPFQILFIYLISTLSYEVIEKRFRVINPSINKLQRSLKIFFTSILIGIFSISLGTIFKGKFYLGNNVSKNPPKNIRTNSKFFIIGDSHAADIENLLLNNKSFKTISMKIGGCKFYEINSKKCKKHILHQEKLISKINKGDVVIFASFYAPSIFLETNKIDYNESKKIIAYFDYILPILEKREAFSILKLPHPTVNSPKVGEALLCKKEFFRPYINPECFNAKGVSKKDFLNKNIAFRELMVNYADKYNNFHLWDVTSIVCPESECVPMTKNNLYFRDRHHLFITSSTLSNSLVNSLNKILIEFANKSS